MARKTKRSNITIIQQQQEINLEDLATKVARAVAKEILESLAITGRQPLTREEIQMDESVIPIAIETAIEVANLENMTKEEKVVDKGLKKSKSKLASILKRDKE